MSKPASKALIGAFVLGAIALAVLTVVIFASGRFFADKLTVVMYFEGSVSGLNVGAPVVFRGVKVGAVRRIELDFDRKDLSFVIPVYAEIDAASIKAQRGRARDLKEGESIAEALIEKGLRGQLEIQSLVTGQLMINLDLLPEKPARLLNLDAKYVEIPTISSGLEELVKTAQELPLKEFFNKLLGAVEGIEKTINSPNLTSSLESLSEGLKEARKIMASIDAQIVPILTNIREASLSAQKIAKEGERVPAQIEDALVATREALKQAQKTLASVEDLATGNSTLLQQADVTLREIEKTSRSIRTLADYLDRQPQSILFGKPSQ